MSQLSLNLSSHNNHFLFSDHYLDDILRRSLLWQREIVPQAEMFFTWLKALYQKEKAQLPQYKEAQLEENWLKPILRRLGHEFEGQGTIPALTQAGVSYPDYLFFATEADRHAAATSPNSAHHAIAVGEVKRWGVPLNRKTKGGGRSFDDNNPSYQIDYYLRATDLTWGILSNGQQWRLVHKESSYKLDVYFEIDLEKALENESLGAIAYFYAFFRQAALVPGSQGRIFLNDALQDSRAYALQLESDLRENAYKALEQLILGFFAPSRNRLDVNNPAHRQQVYNNSLYLLYRILFLFYGESRGLLPMPNPEYRNYSLQALAQTATDLVDEGKNIPPMTTIHWAHLRTLFQIINGDDEALNEHLGVPRYNGGLFNPALYPFLDEHVVGDRHLIQAIDYLGRRAVVREGRYAGRERVDYRTLGVRQLGSIYEGLLEYQPRQASEPMAAVRQKGAEKWLPGSQVKGRTEVLERREPGELFLATDKGERKATGSYYTPDYIVKYIVEQTLGPLVERVRQAAAGDTSRFVAGMLQLNVLDPAMGSGHFLVEATDFLARALATGADVPTGETRPQGNGARRNGEADDLIYWRRQVVERCIYGVDKNRLAVELAKLSLWLVTVAADQPLSFLDHHLRHGDSLVGVRLADLAHAPGPTKNTTTTDEQLLLFDEGAFAQDAFRAVGGMLTIEGMLSGSIEDIHSKEQLYADLRGHLARWKQQADLWVSYYFGNSYSREEYADLARYLQSASEPLAVGSEPLGTQSSVLSPHQFQPFLNHPAVGVNDYFHWELEFPELFFDRNGQPLKEQAGFDAVIGNPPYVVFVKEGKGRQSDFTIYQVISAGESDYYEGNYQLIEYAPNTFSLMTERSINLLSNNGLFGFIYPSTILYYYYHKTLRLNLTKSTTLQHITQLDHVFDDVETGGNAIIILRNHLPDKNDTQILHVASPEKLIDAIALAVPQEHFLDIPWAQWTTSPHLLNILRKSKHDSTSFNNLGDFYQGVCTGDNNKWIVDDSTHPLSIKVLRGKDIQKYTTNWNGKYLIFDKPKMWSNTNEMLLVANPKILLRQTSDSIIASIDVEGLSLIDSLYLFRPNTDLDIRYLLAILNSTLLNTLYRFYSPEENRTFAQVKIVNLKPLPVKNIRFSTSATQRALIVAAATTHYHQANHPALLTLVQDCLAAQPEQADVVHDILAFLAEQMIALNQEKQTLVGRFWTDLEGVTDAAAFPKLRHKGKQAASLVQAVPSLAQFLNPASKSGKTLDESLAWSEDGFKGFVKLLAGKISGLSDLLTVYRAYAPEYRRLAHQLTTSDHLIDEIVYALYGLTEEEIALVEGQAQNPVNIVRLRNG